MDELRILGKQYSIIRTPTPLALSAGLIFGSCDYQSSTITMNAGQDLQQERDTLLHEALHAIDFCMHLELEERQVHALGAGLYALFSDNPMFGAWLSGYEIVDEDAEEPAKKPAKKPATRRR